MMLNANVACLPYRIMWLETPKSSLAPRLVGNLETHSSKLLPSSHWVKSNVNVLGDIPIYPIFRRAKSRVRIQSRAGEASMMYRRRNRSSVPCKNSLWGSENTHSTATLLGPFFLEKNPHWLWWYSQYNIYLVRGFPSLPCLMTQLRVIICYQPKKWINIVGLNKTNIINISDL